MEPPRIFLIRDTCGRLVPDYFHYINMHMFECHEYRISLVIYVSIIIITITNLVIIPEPHTLRGYSYRLRPNLNHDKLKLKTDRFPAEWYQKYILFRNIHAL